MKRRRFNQEQIIGHTFKGSQSVFGAPVSDQHITCLRNTGPIHAQVSEESLPSCCQASG